MPGRRVHRHACETKRKEADNHTQVSQLEPAYSSSSSRRRFAKGAQKGMTSRIRKGIVVAACATLVLSSIGFVSGVLAAPARDASGTGNHVVLTFTKWVTIDPGGGVMNGIVGGDVSGTFAGQVLASPTTNLVLGSGAFPASGQIEMLQAVYEVQAGEHSLRALVLGGYDVATNKARLDGTVLGGWLTGEKVHVEFINILCSQSNAGAQPNAAFGGLCFQGTITITPGAE
jgi:hypothetical protein